MTTTHSRAMAIGALAQLSAPHFVAWIGLLWLIPAAAAAAELPPGHHESQVIYAGGFAGGWRDGGGAPRELANGQPVNIRFADYGRWVVQNPTMQEPFALLRMQLRAPSGFGEFLEIRLGGGPGVRFPAVTVGERHIRDRDGRTFEIVVPADEINPDALRFGSVTLAARRLVGRGWVEVDNIVLYDSDERVDRDLRQAARNREAAASEHAAVLAAARAAARGVAQETGSEAASVAPTALESAAELSVVQRTDPVAIAVFAGAFFPAVGGEPAPTAGAEVRLSTALGRGAVGASVFSQLVWHSLAVSVGDLDGSVLDSSGAILSMPLLGSLGYRAPVSSRLAVAATIGMGGIYMASRTEALGVSAEANGWVLAGRAAGAIEVELGWVRLGLEAAYLYAGYRDLGAALRDFTPGGVSIGLRAGVGLRASDAQ